MNYLAHFHLACRDDEWIAGARLRRDNPLSQMGTGIELHLRNSETIFAELYPQLMRHMAERFSAE